jgi:alkyl hydroperoxide reductase subunit AhpC
MAREQGPMLDVSDVFPPMEFATVDGNRLNLPDNTLGKWTVLLFYRGDW